MRFLRVRARNFGPLDDLDTGEGDPLPSLVAVLGPNEAGKTAFHQAILALLYGFYPASREMNPWAAWSGQTPELEAWIGPGDGVRRETPGEAESLLLHRRLLSRPRGTLTTGDRVEEIRNHHLPEVSHVDRQVFQQVYAVTLADLAGLEGEGWAAVQDRLVVGMGARDLRSPREAAEILEREADTLWRPDRKGKPRFRALEGERAELREARRGALDRDRELRELYRQAGDLEEELEELRTEGARLDRLRGRITRLRPLARRLAKIQNLVHETGPPEELENLPPDPAGLLDELERQHDELRGRGDRLQEQLRDARARAEGPAADGEAILDRMRELRALADRAPALRERRVRRIEVEVTMDRLDGQIRSVARPLFEDGAQPDIDLITGLSTRALRNSIQATRDLDTRLQALRDAVHRVESRPLPDAPERPPMAALVGLGLAVLLLALAALMGPGGARGTLPLGLGIAALVSAAWGAMLFMRWRTRRELVSEAARAREAERAELEGRISRLEEERIQAHRTATEHLDPLPLRDTILGRPDEGLVRELERLRDLLLERERTRATLDGHREEDRELEQTLARLRGEMEGLSELPEDPLDALPALGRILNELSRRRDDAEGARQEVVRIEAELEEVHPRTAELNRRRRELLEGLERASGLDGPVEQMVERTLHRLDAARALTRERDELRREHPDLEREREELDAARAAGEAWLEDPEFLAEVETRRRELQSRIEDARGDLERIRGEIRRGADDETVDLIDGRLAAVEEEMDRVRRERDRRYVLARTIRVAERRFREAHQPDLLLRAGDHLARITGGRYPRLLLGEVGRNPLLVQGEHLPGPHPAEAPLSTGTREQIYLALRLAIVDHLDRERAPLPLFFDEVFVNWDAPRRERGLALLAEMAGERQIFLFTCHPELARSVERSGGRVLSLPGPMENR